MPNDKTVTTYEDRKIILWKQDNGDYYGYGVCGAGRVYTGEDAKILDVLFKYQKKEKK